MGHRKRREEAAGEGHRELQRGAENPKQTSPRGGGSGGGGMGRGRGTIGHLRVTGRWDSSLRNEHEFDLSLLTSERVAVFFLRGVGKTVQKRASFLRRAQRRRAPLARARLRGGGASERDP